MVAVKLTDAEIRANLDAVLLTNELGGKSPYVLQNAGSNSGYSFGGIQWDLSKNKVGKGIILDILNNATDAQGNKFFSSAASKGVYDKLILPGGTSLEGTANKVLKNLVESAMGSDYGRMKTDAGFAPFVDGLVAQANAVISFAPAKYQTFLETPEARIFLTDYANQFGLSPTGPMADLITKGTGLFNGKKTSVSVSGNALGMDDLLDAYLNTKQANNSPAEMAGLLRRFTNIAEATGLFTNRNSGDTILNYLTADVFDCTLG